MQRLPMLLIEPEHAQLKPLPVKGIVGPTAAFTQDAPATPTARHPFTVCPHDAPPQPAVESTVHDQPVLTAVQEVVPVVVKPPGSALHALHVDARVMGETVEPDAHGVAADEPAGHALPAVHGVGRKRVLAAHVFPAGQGVCATPTVAAVGQ